MSIAVEACGPARVVRIDRPNQRNALDRAALRELARAARAVGRDRNTRGIVLTGTGPFFAAGGDLREFSGVRSSAGARRIAAIGHEVVEALWSTGVPVVAAVNGDAFGGACELVAACDYRVVEEQARFHWVQGRFAVTTAWGATARLVSVVGPGVAARWLLTARTVDSLEAERSGFADERVPEHTSVARACALVEAIAAVPRATTRRQLSLLRHAPGRSLDEAQLAETRAFAACWATRAHQDAVERFLSRDRGARVSVVPDREPRRTPG